MGSRMMHLIIADQVYKKIEIEQKELFLLGGIAPDAAFTRDAKTASHFYEGSLKDGTRFVDYRRFIEKYPAEIQSDYGLGYLTHLVSDDVWMKQVYFKNDLKNRVDADPNLLERWHNDFRKLNGKLVEWFDCSSLGRELYGSQQDENNINEIAADDLRRFKEETLEDFTPNVDGSHQELQVYSFEQILQYIDMAASEASKICLSVQKNLNPPALL